MALSEFQTKKMKHLFKLYDVDKDGTIAVEDYEKRIVAVAKHRGFDEGSDEYKTLKERVIKEWEQLQLFSDTDGDGKVTEFEFLEYVDYTLDMASYGSRQQSKRLSLLSKPVMWTAMVRSVWQNMVSSSKVIICLMRRLNLPLKN